MWSDYPTVEEFIEIEKHNEKVRKRIKKFHETGKFLDDNGNEIGLSDIVNYRKCNNG